MLKLWDASKFGSLRELGSGDIEPYMTVRGHRKPITALSGRDHLFPTGSSANIVISGSTNG